MLLTIIIFIGGFIFFNADKSPSITEGLYVEEKPPVKSKGSTATTQLVATEVKEPKIIPSGKLEELRKLTKTLTVKERLKMRDEFSISFKDIREKYMASEIKEYENAELPKIDLEAIDSLLGDAKYLSNDKSNLCATFTNGEEEIYVLIEPHSNNHESYNCLTSLYQASNPHTRIFDGKEFNRFVGDGSFITNIFHSPQALIFIKDNISVVLKGTGLPKDNEILYDVAKKIEKQLDENTNVRK